MMKILYNDILYVMISDKDDFSRQVFRMLEILLKNVQNRKYLCDEIAVETEKFTKNQ